MTAPPRTPLLFVCALIFVAGLLTPGPSLAQGWTEATISEGGDGRIEDLDPK